MSHLRVKIRAYSSSAILPRGEHFRIGDFATGAPVANYGGAGRPNLDSWKRADLSAWDLAIPETNPEPAEFDLREWAIGRLPSLSGRAFATDSPGGNRFERS